MPTPVKIMNLDLDQIKKREDNPNHMSPREFDLLVDNITRMGLVDPILVRPMEDGVYEIVGGHHRYDAVQYLGWTEALCTVITDPDFDQEEADFQLVRMNMISGKMNPAKFFDMYSKYAGKYGDAILQDAFGFADDAEWERLVKQVSKSLPDKKTQAKFEEAAKEIKTIDGLSKLLNKMFTMYGDTLPTGYMVFEFGGQKSIWLQATKKSIGRLEDLGQLCIESGVYMDDVLSSLFEQLGNKTFKLLVEKALDTAPKIAKDEQIVGLPLKDKKAK
jgi:hypothetical protein